MRQALEGVRIVDFTQMMLGPFGTQFLGDMGADVVKIERPRVGEWERGWAAMGQLFGGERSGVGRQVEASLLETALAIQCQELGAHMNPPVRVERSAAGTGSPWSSAPFGDCASADGYVPSSINPLPTVGEALGIPEL